MARQNYGRFPIDSPAGLGIQMSGGIAGNAYNSRRHRDVLFKHVLRTALVDSSDDVILAGEAATGASVRERRLRELHLQSLFCLFCLFDLFLLFCFSFISHLRRGGVLEMPADAGRLLPPPSPGTREKATTRQEAEQRATPEGMLKSLPPCPAAPRFRSERARAPARQPFEMRHRAGASALFERFCASAPRARRHGRKLQRPRAPVRELGGAPRSPAPRNLFLGWIVKPSGCHCTDAIGGNKNCRVPNHPLEHLPFLRPRLRTGARARHLAANRNGIAASIGKGSTVLE